MKKIFPPLFLVGVYLLCSGMGGTIDRSVLGDLPIFSKKIGLPGFSGTVVYQDEKVAAQDICIYDPNDDECTDGGEAVGVVYINVNPDKRPGRHIVWLKDIESLEVLGEGLHAGRREHFIRIKVTYHPNEAGVKKEKIWRVSTKVVLGGKEEAGPGQSVGTVALQDIVAIKEIKMQPISTEELRKRIVGK